MVFMGGKLAQRSGKNKAVQMLDLAALPAMIRADCPFSQ
jgi:hypothetical protein